MIVIGECFEIEWPSSSEADAPVVWRHTKKPIAVATLILVALGCATSPPPCDHTCPLEQYIIFVPARPLPEGTSRLAAYEDMQYQDHLELTLPIMVNHVRLARELDNESYGDLDSSGRSYRRNETNGDFSFTNCGDRSLFVSGKGDTHLDYRGDEGASTDCVVDPLWTPADLTSTCVISYHPR